MSVGACSLVSHHTRIHSVLSALTFCMAMSLAFILLLAADARDAIGMARYRIFVGSLKQRVQDD